jgi:copper transport protein
VGGTTARVDGAGTAVSVTLPPLAPGDYAAIWTVVSADDGHLTDGEVSFSVGPAPPPSSVTVPPLAALATGDEQPRDAAGTVATWLLLVGLALAGGGLAAEALLARSAGPEPPRRLSTGYLAAAMAVALLGCMAAVVITAGRLHDGSVLSGLDVRTWGPALGVRAAVEDLASAALIVNAAGALILLRDRLVALGSLVGAMVLVGMRSHPASVTVAAEVAVVVHVVLALLWCGAVAYLVLMLGRRGAVRAPETAAVVARYARAALFSVLAIVMTGSAAALTLLASPGQLLTTTYGRLLTLKLALVGWTLLVATVGRWRGLGRRPVDATVVRRVVRAELASLLLVLLTTAALANAAPPTPVTGAGQVLTAGAATPVLLLLLGAAGVIVVGTLPMILGKRNLRLL